MVVSNLSFRSAIIGYIIGSGLILWGATGFFSDLPLWHARIGYATVFILILWGLIAILSSGRKREAKKALSESEHPEPAPPMQQISQTGNGTTGINIGRDLNIITGLHRDATQDVKMRVAASQLYSMIRNIRPLYSVPGMDDIYEICERMSKKLQHIEKEIGGYLAKHGAILPKDVHDAILNPEHAAAEGKFCHVQGQPDKAAKAAEYILEQLEQAWETLRADVDSQVGPSLSVQQQPDSDGLEDDEDK